ncbi:hypothetical protein AVP43_01036 [Geobacillus stearothermophilus]|nr:hypothetical protein AVP43_01036 [Geobacillus stearothermophilus]
MLTTMTSILGYLFIGVVILAVFMVCELPTTYASLRGGGFKRLVCVR